MLRRSALTLLFALLMFYVLLNVYSSQTVHPLYFKQAQHENRYAVRYLSAIRSLPQFDMQYRWYNSLSQQDIHDGVYEDMMKRGNEIAALEKYLAVNPDARDVLLALSRLYRLQGDFQKEDKYYIKAKTVDPGIQ